MHSMRPQKSYYLRQEQEALPETGMCDVGPERIWLWAEALLHGDPGVEKATCKATMGKHECLRTMSASTCHREDEHEWTWM